MMDMYLIFQFFKGRCHGKQITLQKCYQHRLIPLAFVALVLENKLQYYGLAVRVNSGDDGATSCKNFVNFCLITGLICIRLVWHGQNTGVYSLISPYILDRYSQSFHHMKTLYVQMMALYLIFQFVKGRFHVNQIILPLWRQTDTMCIFFARLQDGSSVLVLYYLLGGDIAAPSGLYARLCHAFLFLL